MAVGYCALTGPQGLCSDLRPRTLSFSQPKGRFVDQRSQEIAALKKDWAENPRWKGITRSYSAEDVVRLRGSLHIEHTLARLGAEKLWKRWPTRSRSSTRSAR